MKLNSVVRSLAVIFFAYLFLFVVSYSTFLQIPVFANQSLVWQSIIEQSITWIPFLVGYIYLHNEIKKRRKTKKSVINEKKLLIPSIISIFLIGMSVGVHFSSQIIEDVLINQQELFAYKVAYFFDEQVGHLFIVPGIILSLIFASFEINRAKPKLTKTDTWATNILAIITAVTTSIMSVEAGLIYLMSIPLIAFGYYQFIKIIYKHKIKIMDYPFNRYFLIITIITTVFSICWWIINGFAQPEELGLQLIS